MLKRLNGRIRVISAGEFKKMESDASTGSSDLLPLFHEYVSTAMKTMDSLMAHPDYRDARWRAELHTLSHDLRGLGGSFDYDLLTTVGDSLCRLIKTEALPEDPALQRRVSAHVAAVKAIIQFELKGDGGGAGKELLATLNIHQRELEPGANQYARSP